MQLFDDLPDVDVQNLKDLVFTGDKKVVFDYLRNLKKDDFIEEVSLAGYSLISHRHGKMTVIDFVMRQI
ncbi:MAG: hypothetical protein COA54_03395 [Thiotrichaceae bacterium]|nr:MAG: hypothetical protein COA54_03395 [Thiotrichaceae bacterium]